MNKLIVIIAIIVFGLALVLSSCKKNYVCTCTLSGGTAVVKYDLGKKSRSDADSECKAKEGAVLGVTYTCQLD